jgi:hypothetical protein
MKMRLSLWLMALCVVLVLQRCSDDDQTTPTPTPEPAEPGPFEKAGVLVANEGGFGSGNATLSFYDGTSLQGNIFKNAGGQFAGDVLQSVTIDGDKAYLVLNGSNAIEVANSGTFKGKATFTHKLLDKPRNISIINGKAYVSVWGPYAEDGFTLTDSYVLIADTSTWSLIDTLRTDEGTDDLLYGGKYLFASNNNFGGSSTLAVVDPAKNELVDQLELAPAPAGMVLDANKKLWVVTQGTYSQDGKLFRINPTTLEIEAKIELNVDANSDLGITPDGKTLVYSAGSKVYRVAIDATEAPATAFIDATGTVVTLYALGVDPTTGEIYVGDAKNYITEGMMYVYKTDGTLKTSMATGGIDPGQFIFKK